MHGVGFGASSSRLRPRNFWGFGHRGRTDVRSPKTAHSTLILSSRPCSTSLACMCFPGSADTESSEEARSKSMAPPALNTSLRVSLKAGRSVMDIAGPFCCNALKNTQKTEHKVSEWSGNLARCWGGTSPVQQVHLWLLGRTELELDDDPEAHQERRRRKVVVRVVGQLRTRQGDKGVSESEWDGQIPRMVRISPLSNRE